MERIKGFNTIKLIIAGPRNLNISYSFMSAICANFNLHKNNVEEVVCGMARGIDMKGEYWAMEQTIPIKRFHANWDEYGNAAGSIRNKEMAEYADTLLIIWTGNPSKNKGSHNMKQNMISEGKPIYEIIIKEPENVKD